MVWQRRGLELVKVTLSWQGHSDHNPAGNLELCRKCSEERGEGAGCTSQPRTPRCWGLHVPGHAGFLARVAIPGLRVLKALV